MNPKNTFRFFIAILFMAVIGALGSCTTEEPVYYLQVNNECVNIVNQDTVIICVLDGNIQCHNDYQSIIDEIDNGQIGYYSVFVASHAYWNLVKQP